MEWVIGSYAVILASTILGMFHLSSRITALEEELAEYEIVDDYDDGDVTAVER